jgi:hypothetical protein
MDHLEADERALLDRYVALRTPDEAAVAKAYAATLHRVEHGPAVVLPEEPTTRPHVVWARVAMFAIAAAAIVLIAWRGIAALERTQLEAAPVESAPLVVEPSATEGDAEVRVPEPAREVVAPVPPAIEAAPIEPVTTDRAVPTKRPRATPTLADELALLRDADAALARGDAKKALALLDAHSKQFPRGQMIPERMLQRAVALCRLGKREKSRAAIDKLLAAYPTTPLRARASTVCAEESP